MTTGIKFVLESSATLRGWNDTELKAVKLQSIMKQLKISTSGFGRQIGSTMKETTKVVDGAEVTLRKYKNVVEQSDGSHKIYEGTLQKVGKQWKILNDTYRTHIVTAQQVAAEQSKIEKATKKAAEQAEKATKKKETLIQAMKRLAIRSALIVPIWGGIRRIMGLVTSAVRDVTKTYADFDVQMARVGTVNLEHIDQLDRLRKTVLGFSAGASRGFAEAASAMYALGSAGLTVQQQVVGLNHVMNTAIGTFGNTEEVAKLMAGSFNVFGKSMEGVYTDAAKLERIANVLTYTYANQQVEMSEIANAMTYVASVGSLLDISFTELVTTIGVLNTGMLKGSKSGTSLLNAFVQVANQSDRLADLGVIFDPSAPLDFKDIMEQLSKKYGEQAIGLNDLKDIMQVFGRRGGRAAAQLIKEFKNWQQTITDTENTFDNFAESMREQAETSLPAAFNKLWNSIKAGAVQSLSGIGQLLAGELDKHAAKQELKNIRASRRELGLTDKEDISPSGGQAQQIIKSLESQASAVETLREANERRVKSAKAIDFVENLIHGKKKEQISVDKEIEEITKQVAEGTLSQSEGLIKIIDLLKSAGILNKHNLRNEAELVQIYREQFNTKKEELKTSYELNDSQKEKLRLLKEGAKYSGLALGRMGEEEITQQKLIDAVARMNEKVAKSKVAGAERLSVESLINGEFEKAEALITRIGGAEADILEIEKLSLDYNLQKVKAAQEYSSAILDTAETGLSDILSGESDFATFTENFTKAIRKSFADAIAEGIFDNILKDGLLEGVLGGALGGLKNLFGGKEISSAQTLYLAKQKTLFDAHVMGIRGALAINTRGGVSGLAGAGAKLVGTPTQAFDPGAAAGRAGRFAEWQAQNPTNNTGLKTAKTAGLGSKVAGLGGTALLAFGAGSTFNQAAGGGTLGAVAGIAGGIGAGMLMAGSAAAAGIAAGTVTSGVGVLGTIGAANAWNPVGWALLAVAAVLTVIGMSRGKKKWQQEEITEQTKQITSKIDVSNSELQWVNRNLVALRQELTYILPRSAYFSEQVSDNFSVDAQRGVF